MKATYLHTLVFTTLALLATSAFAEQAEHKSYRHSQKQVLTFDVAEAGAKFSFDEAPLFPVDCLPTVTPLLPRGIYTPRVRCKAITVLTRMAARNIRTRSLVSGPAEDILSVTVLTPKRARS